MTWTFYNALGQEKRAMSTLLPSEYAMQSSVQGGSSTVGAAWTRLAMGAPDVVSSAAASCLRFNADGTVTILQTGWYSLVSAVQFSPATAGTGQIQGWWVNAGDTTPGVTPTPLYRTEIGASNATAVTVCSYLALITAGVRIGVAAFNRVTSGAAFSNGWSIARVAAGPQGDNAEWLYGTGAPDNAGGGDGDLYLQDDGKVWDKQGVAWVYTGISLKGPQGSPGSAGLSVVTTLPNWATVTDGQQIIYMPDVAVAVASPQHPVAWHLIANKGHTPPWQDGWIVAGGEPLITGAFPAWNNATALGTAVAYVGGPTITLPKGGIWRIRFGPLHARLASNASAILQVETGLMRQAAGANWVNTVSGGVARKQTIFSPVNYAGADLSLDYTEQLGGELHKIGQLFSGGTAQTLFNVSEGALVNPVRMSAMPLYLDT